LSSLFVENGGAVCYEFVPLDIRGGLFEASTPECRGPGQLLLYQKAQEEMLLDAVEEAKVELVAHHQVEELGLIKNCRDAQGHIYGAQENLDAELARGLWLWLYRVGLAALIPFVLIFTLFTWVILLTILILGIAILPAIFLLVVSEQIIPRLHPLIERVLGENGLFERAFFRLTLADHLVAWPLGSAYSLLLMATGFRRFRRGGFAFLASRCLLSGAGSVTDDGGYTLSEKGPSIVSTMRRTGAAQSRSIIDTGNLLKRLFSPAALQIAPLISLFGARQRLQLGLADSNMAQVAEYLKIGSTCLVLDMAELGWLDDAPRLRDTVGAVRLFSADPTLQAKAELRDGGAMSALELQRWYLERASRFVNESTTTSLEAREVLRLWNESLDALERDPGGLVGRLDWVTKRWLIEETAGDGSLAVRKRVDLGYHELGQGFFVRLERIGLAPRLVTVEEARAAIHQPPEASPARLRSRLIREIAQEQKVTVDWGSVRIGGRLRGKVIRLDDYRRP
jgi:proteasome accessory factor A